MSEPLPWEQVGKDRKVSRTQAGMLVDLRRCVGCHACSIACKTEKEIPLGEFQLRVRWHERPDRPTMAFVPMLCMHCAYAPCMKACPSEAIVRGEDGRVLVDRERCNGDGACVTACPYGAIYVDERTKKADKCDFCTHRTEVGLDPACVTACPTTALRFGDLADPIDPVAISARKLEAKPFKEKEGTKPVVLYTKLEPFMEEKANRGVALSPDDADIIYEQP